MINSLHLKGMPPRSNRAMNSQSTQWKDQTSSQSPPNLNEPTYTLPGVINYLTSEFTNLERFRIMTKLEKSEMKYKILRLEGEIKTLKYASQKQQAKIESLEKENMLLKSKSKEYKHTPVMTEDPDLESIKKSREQLKDSTKEIVALLRSPSTRLGELNLEGHQQEIEEMIDNSEDDFVFGRGTTSPKSNLIAQFFDVDEKLEKVDEEKLGKMEEEEKLEKMEEEEKLENLEEGEKLERSLTNESEATVIDIGEEKPQETVHEVPTRSFENGGVTTVLRIAKDIATISTSGRENAAKEIDLKHLEVINNVIALHNESYLIVGKDIKLLTEGEPKTLIPTKSSFSEINASALIDMTVAGDNGKTYGLAISGVSNGTKSFLSKVYQISFNGQPKSKELGSFNRKFLTKNKGGSEISFVGWRYDKDKSAPPSPSKGGTKNAPDPRLALYDVVYRVGDQNYKINLSLKQVLPIED